MITQLLRTQYPHKGSCIPQPDPKLSKERVGACGGAFDHNNRSCKSLQVVLFLFVKRFFVTSAHIAFPRNLGTRNPAVLRSRICWSGKEMTRYLQVSRATSCIFSVEAIPPSVSNVAKTVRHSVVWFGHSAIERCSYLPGARPTKLLNKIWTKGRNVLVRTPERPRVQVAVCPADTSAQLT